MSRLNPRQREAVHYIGGPLLVLAGAGSGKTSVITRKIAWMVQDAGIEARRIAAVTFTNKAAREMKERVSQLLGKQEGRGLTVSTFHTLGLSIIRRERKHLGLKSGFSLFDDQDSKALLRDLMLQNDEDTDQLNEVQHRISNWKNDMLTPDQALAEAQLPQDILAARAYEAYDRHLRAYNAVDFDDLILLPVQLFSNHPDVLERWQRRIQYLLVDEYQDTNLSSTVWYACWWVTAADSPWWGMMTSRSTPGAVRGRRIWPSCRPTFPASRWSSWSRITDPPAAF